MEQARHSELRVLRWTDRIQSVLSGKVEGPIKANLDLTNLCSHNCAFGCEPIDFRKATIADKCHTLQFETAVSVIGDLASLDCKCVVFSGGGEPTLHPEFGTLLHQAHTSRMRTWVVTHGGLIHHWRAHLGTHADHIRVSLDASNGKEHQAVHQAKEGEFDQILHGIKGLLADREARGKGPEVGIAYVVTPGKNDSTNSLNRAVGLADSLGVDYLHFRPASGQTMVEQWHQVSETIEEIKLTHPRTEIWALGRRLNDVFTQREFEKCYMALTMATIGANGDVSACCDRRDLIFGNVNQKRFMDIWLSDVHRAKAAAIVPQFCQRCLQCGFNRSVERNIVHNDALPELL